MAKDGRTSEARSRCLRALLGLLLVSGLAACSVVGSQPTVPAPTPLSELAVPEAPPGVVHANGVLHPVRARSLSFGIGGTVALLDVEIGRPVREGQLLAKLDETALQCAVDQASLDLESARLQLAQTEAQATPVPAQVIAATAAISSAQAALVQAQTQSDLRGNQTVLDRAALTQAEQALRDAQNAYDNLLGDATTKDWAPYSPAAAALAGMQHHYDLTLAAYRLHSADRGYDAAIATAEAQVAQAKVALYEAEYPVAPEALALARLAVTRAEQAYAVAQEDLGRATLAAPFDGVVSVVSSEVGQWIAPGAPVVELLDVSRWRLETRNVGELEIGRVAVGQAASVHVNAFSGVSLVGRVVTISPVAVVQQGDTTYALTIELEPTDLPLRPGMTAQVAISTGPGE